MIDRRLDRLMNQELDGANGPAERETLRAALETSREARDRYESLRAAHELLRGAEGPAPGPDFAKGVLTAVRRNARPAAPERLSWRPAAFGPLRLKYALFFGLGLSLGLLILVVFKTRPVDAGLDARQLAGTVAEARSLRPAGVLHVEEGGISRDLILFYGDGCLVAKLQGNATAGVVLTFDRDRLSFDALRRTQGDQGSVIIAPGRLQVQTSGPHAYVLVFAARGGLPLTLHYRDAGAGRETLDRDLTVTEESLR
jgi:hypothetical protein